MRRSSAYRVFLTRNSEYHVRGMVCFGVRNRRLGTFVDDHWALGQRLVQAFVDAYGRLQSVGVPVVGEPLRFEVGGEAHTTTPVLGVEEREHMQVSGGCVSPLEALLCRPPPLDPRETY